MAMSPEASAALIAGVFGIIALIVGAIIDKRKQQRPQQEVSLAEHPFFARMLVLKRHITSTFTLANKGKQEIFKEILKAKIETTTAALQDAIPEIESCCATDGTRLYNIHMEILQKSMKDFQYFYKDDKYTPDEQKALALVMQKFDKWNATRIEYLTETIQMVCNSPFYSDCITKASVLFDVYLGVFIDTINDAERTLNSLNGDLTGLIFRSYVM